MPAILQLIALLSVLHIETGEACKQKMDLCFLIDGSSTVCDGNEPCENWKSVLNFSKNISNALDIGPESDRVAMATFFNTTEVNWNLRNYTAKTPLLSAIDSVAYNGGEFYDLPSADKIVTQVFNRQYGERKPFQNVLLMITDGVPNVDEAHAAAIGSAYEKNGIAVFVVCVATGCTENWAKVAATKPQQDGLKTYFLVGSYSALDSIREAVLEQICYFLVGYRSTT